MQLQLNNNITNFANKFVMNLVGRPGPVILCLPHSLMPDKQGNSEETWENGGT